MATPTDIKGEHGTVAWIRKNGVAIVSRIPGYNALISAIKRREHKNAMEKAENALKGMDDGSVFTPLEKELCGHIFSLLEMDPIPEKYVQPQGKPYMDQIVSTKGYGVTIRPPLWYPSFFNVPNLASDVQKYIDQVIDESLLGEIKKKTGKVYKNLGVERTVMIPRADVIYLVTIGVEDEEEEEDASVEFIVFVSRAAGSPMVLGKDLQLREWKLKSGSIVVCCGLFYPITIKSLFPLPSGVADLEGPGEYSDSMVPQGRLRAAFLKSIEGKYDESDFSAKYQREKLMKVR